MTCEAGVRTGYHGPAFILRLDLVQPRAGPSLVRCTTAFSDPMPLRPTDIVLHRQSRILEIAFDDGQRFSLPCEFLRVLSPSAEVRGHGPGQEVLQAGKKDVNIRAVEPVGSYAVKLVFTDGHDTGLYSWEYLHELGRNQEWLWRAYLQKLEKAGASRDPVPPKVAVHRINFMPRAPGGTSGPPSDE